ncbi:MAG: PAS domain S-box protein [Promethearchaeota archaeon]|nr:MAG: PAS domain S-box protein [Candidatus Lokiarchaeota archaeon]
MEIAHNDQNAILFIDPNSGIILEANKQSENLLDKKRKEIIGLKIENILFNGQNKKTKRFLRKIKQNKTQSIYFLRNTDKGDPKHLSIKASECQINNNHLIKCTLREETQKIRIEDFLLGTSRTYLKLEEIINQGPIVVFLCANKKNWPIIYASENISKFGYTTEDLKSENINLMNLIHPDDIERLMLKEDKMSFENNSEFRAKCRITTKFGDIKWVIIHIWARKNSHENITHRLGVMLDITKRKQAEEAREESEERFKRMADNIRDGLTIIENREIIYINDRICEITGYSREELMKLSGVEIAAPEEKGRVKKFMENVNNGVIPLKDFEYWIIRKDGSRRYIHNRYSCSQGNEIIDRFIITTDITERKLAEQKLKESEERFRTLYENIAGGILIIGHDYIIKDVNNRTCEITGFSREELIGQYCNLICAKGAQYKLCPIWEEGKQGIEGMDTTIKCKNGRLNPIIKNIKKINLEGKIYILENFQDIAECKLTEQKLRESEEKYRELVNSANSIILKWDIHGKIIYMNEFGLNFFGYTSSELTGHHVVGTIVPETETSGRDLVLLMDYICENPDKYENNENENITKQGKKVWISWSNKSIKDEQGNVIGILSVGNDITDRKIAEEKLKESEIKHRLAYNKANFYKDLFAHDMSNILHNILSSIELYTLCQKYPEKLEKGEDLLEIIRDQAKRGAKLISNVNKLSRLEEIELNLQKVEMLPYLKDAFKFVEASFRGRKINVILDTQNEKLFILANELILDVFENLLINSVKYNNNNSVLIHIKISKEIQDDIKHIKLQFIDNGIGIPDFRKETIFQRTLNEDNSVKGMGIGLSLVRSILSSFNGHISIEDKEPGDYTQGCNFIIYIPEAE